MRRQARGLASTVALCCGIWALATASAVYADEEDDKLIKAAQKDVIDLAKGIEGGKVDAAKVKAMRKKYEELNHIMYIFKPREKGGLGIGPKGPGDGIELKINSLGKRALSPMELKAQRAELIQMGYIASAMSEVATAYAPVKPKAGKGAKEWKQYAGEMKKSSQELIDAVKKGNAPAVKAAATNLGNSCVGCHADFRDVVD
jgi:cytochrome c556